MWECEGESGCARVCESVCEKEDPRSLFITIITSHHHHPLFNQYIDLQAYIYIYSDPVFFCAKQVHHKYSARLSLSQTTKAACPPALAVHTWFRALAQAAHRPSSQHPACAHTQTASRTSRHLRGPRHKVCRMVPCPSWGHNGACGGC